MERHLSNYNVHFLLKKKKNLNKLGTDGNFHSLRKNIYKIPTIDIIWRNVLNISSY